ncbi:MAG: metallophosphatase [Flavobacteriaceae bacterium]|nr:metallophosphatase [Flavobacteriaceae bacterium]
MNRRNFIKNTALATGAISAGSLLLACEQEEEKKLTILHTNDVHSHIEGFPKGHKYEGLGGISGRAALIEQIRNEQDHVLLLDAGDIFQGTPYFNFFGGELELKLMSTMKYDAATMGNHDFDNGIDGFLAQLPHAAFDFLCANYDFTNTVLDGYTHRKKIIDKGGIKIGLFGLGVELNGLVDQALYKETKYLNPVEIAQDVVQELRNEDACDLVICLSHLGYHYNSNKIDDLKLAHSTDGIDFILGGHTHTFLEKPSQVKSRNGGDVWVNQTGCYGVNLGRIDVVLSKAKPRITHAAMLPLV